MTPETALITGASSGIGLELAHVLAREGHNLVLVARGADRLNKLAKTLAREYGVRVETISTDLIRPGEVASIISQLKTDKIRIDILVNDAGIGSYGEFTDTSWAHETKMIELNISVLTQLTKHYASEMKRHQHGRILNLASTAAFVPGPMMAVYYATKAYVLSFSVALAEELRGTGVTVTALCPGPTKTGFANVASATRSPIFRGRLGSARQVAEVGYRGLMRGQVIVIPRWRNKLAAFTPRLLSRRHQARLVHRSS